MVSETAQGARRHGFGGELFFRLLAHDLLGALARDEDGTYALPTEPTSFEQRQYAIRFAVNIAMYVLCSDYKDDQVHAPFLMRRRAQSRATTAAASSSRASRPSRE